MFFKIQTEDINYGMGMISRAIAVRPPKPIYEGVLIETPETGLLLTATDGEITVKAQIEATIVEDGCCIMPAKLFAELMRKQSSGEVDVRIDQNMRASIKTRGSSTNMVGMTAEDFPEINDVVGENVVHLPCGRLRDAISKILFAVSTDEARKILTGILIETTSSSTSFIGLDGFRLALQKIEGNNTLPQGKDKISAVIPGKTLTELSKMLPDDDQVEATFTYNQSHVMIEFNHVKLYSTLLTGEFIDYKRILPASSTTEIVIERSLFGEAIDRCGLMAREGKSNLIYLDIEDEKMIMTSTAEKGNVHEEIYIGKSGNDLKIAFNARYLTDIIRNTSSDKIKMCFNSSVSPCVVKPVEGENYIFLVLPVRTFDRG